MLWRANTVHDQIEKSRPRLFRMAYAWSHNSPLAEDLVQETLVKALRNASRLRDAKALDSWLFSILANCWHDHFRRHREMEDVDNYLLAHSETPEWFHRQKQVVSVVRAAVAQLAENQRLVVTLIDLEGFSYSDVAEILAIPIGTVMSRLCRARKILKELLLEAEMDLTESSINIRRVK